MTPTYWIDPSERVGGYQYIAQGASAPERGDKIDVVDITDHYLIEGVEVIGIDGGTGWAIVQIPFDDYSDLDQPPPRHRQLLPVCPVATDAADRTVRTWVKRTRYVEPVDLARDYISGRLDPDTLDLRDQEQQ